MIRIKNVFIYGYPSYQNIPETETSSDEERAPSKKNCDQRPVRTFSESSLENYDGEK